MTTSESPPDEPLTAQTRTNTVRMALFLGAVAIMQFGYPVTMYGPLWVALYMLGYVAMILFGLRIVGRRDRTRPVFSLLAVAVIIAGSWYAFAQHDRIAQTFMLATVGLFQLALLSTVFRLVLRAGKNFVPTVELLLAALSAYLLLGGVFAVAFNMLETFVPGSFVDAGAPDRPLVWQGLMYASYVTLTTLGFGDVVAVGQWARSLVTLEAVLGTLFLAIVIARLVGSRD